MRCIQVFGFLIFFALSPIARAQSPSVEDLQKDAAALREVATKLQEQNDDLRKRLEGKESALWDHYYKAKESEYDFQIEMMNINARSFQHQNVASYVILALVVFVVGGGLYFAHIQLMAGLQPITSLAAGVQAATVPAAGNATTEPPLAPANVPLGTTTVSAEVGKVTVTSSVVGVIVLVISLAFLYIYTREVYHIQVVDPFRPILKDPVQTESTKSGAPSKK